MSRLRHPINSLKEPFGKAGLTVAILALVLAMVGGAWAAGALTGKQKKEVTAIAKKYAGKPGAPGANGTNGTNGAKGATGPEGHEGEAGKSVVSTEFAGNAEPGGHPCHEQGGTSLEVQGTAVKHYACNGQTGFTKTLPSGKTETGTWVFSGAPGPISGASNPGLSSSEKFFVAISFPIPLPQTNPPKETLLDEHHVHYIGYEELLEGTVEPAVHLACPSEASVPHFLEGRPLIEPEAAPGNLCVYEESDASLEHGIATGVQTEGTEGTPTFNKKAQVGIGPTLLAPFNTKGADATGGLLWLHEVGSGAHEEHYLTGTWAVTAP
jgi:hypothetical protein